MTAAYFGTPTFLIRWPRPLVAAELDRLIALVGMRQPITGVRLDAGWEKQVEHFMREVFSDPAAISAWELARRSARGEDWSPWGTADATGNDGSDLEWLRGLRQHVADLPVPQPRPAYWSQRNREATPTVLMDLRAVAGRFAELVAELEEAGYLAWALGQLCPDGDQEGQLGAQAAEAVHRVLEREWLWPVATHHVNYSLHDLCDVVEFLADHVRRPTTSWLHDYCGEWHYEDFDAAGGLLVYRWRLNELLQNSTLHLTLAATGRLERTAPGGVEELVAAVREVDRVHDADAAELDHALAQFRVRQAGPLERRQAVVTLAGILERRRALLKEHLFSKDEGALFQLANNFGIRHQNANQQTDYDADLYLEWIFYWYLATIHLTNRIVTGSQSTAL